VKAKITDKELMMASCETLNALYSALTMLNPKAADAVKTIMVKKGCPIGAPGAPASGQLSAVWL